jgi:hypothetical protein
MKPEDKIAQIEEEIRATPYHKGTEHHVGKLKAKIAKLKEEALTQKMKKSGGSKEGYAIKKSGEATVILVGPPSVGKSTLINQITRAQSKVADYDFTTINVIPGMMNYKGAKIQILDVPGIIEGAAEGKGRGKQVLSVIRAADLILIMVDVTNIDKVSQIKKELYNFGIRLEEEKPKVYFRKTSTGGIKVTSTPLTHFSLDTVKQIAREFKIRNCEITIKENLTLERLIDAFMGNRVYLPYLIVVNKIDLSPFSSKNEFVLISAEKGTGIEELKEEIWQKLGLTRIFLKPRNNKVDLSRPLIVKKGQNLKDILENLSISDKENIKKAKISGPGAKFSGQEVSLNFQPQEGTIVSFWGDLYHQVRTNFIKNC